MKMSLHRKWAVLKSLKTPLSNIKMVPNNKKVTYVVVVTSSSIQKIHSLVVVEDLVVVEVVVVVEAVVGAGVAGVTGVPVVVSNKNSSRSTALSVTSSNSIVLSSVVSSSISELFSD